MTDQSLPAAFQGLIERTAESILRQVKGQLDRLELERSLEKELFRLGTPTTLRRCFEEYKTATLEDRIRHRSKTRADLEQNWAREETELLVSRLLSEAADDRLRRVLVDDPDQWKPTASSRPRPALRKLIDEAVSRDLITKKHGRTKIRKEARDVYTKARTLTAVRKALSKIRAEVEEQSAHATDPVALVRLKTIGFIADVIGVRKRRGPPTHQEMDDDSRLAFGLKPRPKRFAEWNKRLGAAVSVMKAPSTGKTPWKDYQNDRSPAKLVRGVAENLARPVSEKGIGLRLPDEVISAAERSLSRTGAWDKWTEPTVEDVITAFKRAISANCGSLLPYIPPDLDRKGRPL